MKKHLLLVALAGVALAGCVKNEVETPVTKDVKIGFASPVLNSNVDTKASVYGEIGSHQYSGTQVNYSYPREESFRIFAVEHNGALTSWADATPTAFNNTAISYNGSLDAWAPLTSTGNFYYWPDNKQLSFAAVSPANLDIDGVVATYGATGTKIENFVVADNPAKQYDLLFSRREVNKTADDMVDMGASYYSGLPLVFQHALSSIHFSLKKDNTVTEKVILHSITLKNVVSKATFNEKITNETTYTSSPAWTTSTEDADKKDYVSFTGNVEFPINPRYVSDLAASDDAEGAEKDNDVSHALLMIPQTLGDNVVVDVKYQVGEEIKTRTVQINKYSRVKTKDEEVVDSTPISRWEVGTRYTYRLYYSKDAQMDDIIYFAPSTEGWTEGGVIEVIL
jgi:hypothetical protein